MGAPHRSYIQELLLINLKILLLSWVIAFIFLNLVYPLFISSHVNSDLRAFYTAAKIIQDNPTKLYNLDTQSQYQEELFFEYFPQKQAYLLPFVNPPFILIPIIPLTLLNFKTAYLTSGFFLFGLLLYCIYLLKNIFPVTNKSLVILWALSFAPVYITLSEMQNSIVSLFLFILFYYLYKKRAFFLSGFVTSLLLYKPQIAFLLITYILLFGDKRAKKGLLIGSLFIIFLNLVLVNFDVIPFLEISHWYSTNFETNLIEAKSKVSFLGLLAHLNYFFKFLPVQSLAWILSGFASILMFWTIFRLKKAQRFSGAAFCLVIITTILSGIHVHYHDAILLLIPLFWIYHKYDTWKTHLIIGLGWTSFLIANLAIYSYKIIFFHPTIYLIFGYFLLIHLLRKNES